MFGLFKSPPFTDPALGELAWQRGFWHGQILLSPGSSVPVFVSGTRKEPDAQAIHVARGLSSQFLSLKPRIETALFEHYEPYAEAVASGEFSPQENLPKISAPAGVWPHVSLAYVSVSPLSGSLTTEFGYTVAWDEEHTLGARFQDVKFVELCGSVVPP
mgnify:CR=1 FL=1